MTTATADVSPYRGRRRAPSSGSLEPAPAPVASAPRVQSGLTTPIAPPATRLEARRAAGATTRTAARRAASSSARPEPRRRAGVAPARFGAAPPPPPLDLSRGVVLPSAQAQGAAPGRRHPAPAGGVAVEPATSRTARRAAERTRRREERLDVVGRAVRETPPPSEPAPAARPLSRAEARRHREELSAAKARARRRAIAAQRSRIASTAGIAGALAVTAVAAQALSGPLAGDPASADSTSDRTPRTDVLAAPSGTLLMVSPAVVTPPPRVLPVSRAAKRKPAATVLAGCDGRSPVQEWANGRIPLSDLCKLTFAPGHRLRADAAVALARLNLAYRAQFGDDLCLTDSYRSFASQMSLAARKPGLAARPGTSEHGWGLAVDMCDGIESFRSERHQWMRENAPDFGWDNPPWARADGKRPEAWHWEYVLGTR